jgi:hypothetical protein
MPTSWHGHELHAAGQLTFAAVEGPSIYWLPFAALEATIQDSAPGLAFAAETSAVGQTETRLLIL